MSALPGSRLWRAQAHLPTVLADSVVIVRGEGAHLVTAEGDRLLDATAGLWHANVGHGRPEIARAAFDQLSRLETHHVFGPFTNDRAESLAARVAEMAPIPDARVFFTSGGSDSVDLACKLARRWAQVAGEPARTTIVSRVDAYHGLHGFGTSIAGIPPNREGYGGEIVPETARVHATDLDVVRAQVDALGPERIAAIVAEPVIGTGGVVPPPPGYLAGLQDLARRSGSLFVVDEVITGFGRTGEMFATAREGLDPDMVLVAKGITSGYAPLGGVIVAPRVWGPFADGPDAPIFRHGITYSGHATSCAIADANLDILRDEALVERAARLTPALDAALAPLRGLPGVREVRSGYGFLAGVELDAAIPAPVVAAECVRRGVIVRALHRNTLQVSPPFVIEEDDLGRIADTIAAALPSPVG